MLLSHFNLCNIFLISYYALPGILGTLMSQTVTLCPRLVFVSIVTIYLVIMSVKKDSSMQGPLMKIVRHMHAELIVECSCLWTIKHAPAKSITS